LKPLELADENSVILLLLEQKYLEFLKNEQVPEALNTIREEITPLGLDPRLLHKLASKILKPDPVGEEEDTEVVLSEHTDEVWFLTFSHDGKCLASSSKDKTAILWEVWKFTQKHKLVGHEKPVVAVLWSDEPFYLSEYDGHKRTRFIIRSCFGGYDEDFIASGSEDSQVYIWHVAKGLRPCRVLRGHSGAVNCVSWKPTDIHMLASGSDDRTIRIWGLAKK
ncbi:unnamed protein product, partial [Brassica oleracea]